MSLADLYPPITAATVVAGVWFFIAYRMNKHEVRGRESWRFILFSLLLPIAIISPLFTAAERPTLHVFLTALSAIAAGCSILYVGSLSFRSGIQPASLAYYRVLTCLALLLFTVFLIL